MSEQDTKRTRRDIRDAIPYRGRFAVHKLDYARGANITLCGRMLTAMWDVEPEVDGQRAAWRARIKGHTTCNRCARFLELLVEEAKTDDAPRATEEQMQPAPLATEPER